MNTTTTKSHPITITLGELRQEMLHLARFPDSARVYFGDGDLTFYRFKERGPKEGPALLQCAFVEAYTVTATAD